MRVIFGSGIIGLIAREILGQDWMVVPFSRSRFYSFKPALDDNFIIRDDRIDDIVGHFGGKPSYIYKTSYSLAGELFGHNKEISNAWLAKVFGEQTPTHAAAYMASRNGFGVYDLRVNKLYQTLQTKYRSYLAEESKKGPVTSIGDHHFTRGGQRIEFESAICSIPLDMTLKLAGVDSQLSSRQVWYYHIGTNNLDFEGAHQTLVVDGPIDFYKVANIANGRYLFYCLNEIVTPGPYFMAFMKQFDILDGTTIEKAIPLGDTPKLDSLEKYGIHCVGASAQWDWCMDLGSSLIRLQKVRPLLN